MLVMISSENVRSKKSPGCLLDISGTTPGFSVKPGSGSSADGDTAEGIGSLLKGLAHCSSGLRVLLGEM